MGVLAGRGDSPGASPRGYDNNHGGRGQGHCRRRRCHHGNRSAAPVRPGTEQFEPLDILVNTADVRKLGSLGEVTEEDFHHQFYANVLGVILTAKEAAGRFGPDGGSIIDFSSTAAHVYEPDLLIYTATKSAVEAVTRVLAKELGPRNIRVNAVAPGPIEADGGRSQGLAGRLYADALISQTPLGRLGRPKEIATVVAFLASWHAQWVTGEVILASGGPRP